MKDIDHESSEFLEHIWILGPNFGEDESYEMMFEQIRDEGKRVIMIKNSSEFDVLRDKVGPETRIDILAHGAPGYDEQHFVLIPPLPNIPVSQMGFTPTRELFKYFSENAAHPENWRGVQIYLWSCFGGLAQNSAHHLPVGSTLVTHAPPNKIGLHQTLLNSLAYTLERHDTNCLKTFAQLLAYSPENMAITQTGENGLFFHARHPEQPLCTERDTQDFILNRLRLYSSEVQMTQGEPLIDVEAIELQLSPERLQHYARTAAFLYAFRESSIDYIREYLDKTQMNPQDFWFGDLNLVHIAIHKMREANQDETLLNFLIQHNVNFNIQERNAYGGTPLIWACKSGLLDTVRRLIDAGADVNFQSPEGITPLMDAAYEGHTLIVQTLLEVPDIQIDAVRDTGHTALLLAVQEGHEAVIDLLLEYNASIEMMTETGVSALWIAAANGHSHIITKVCSRQLLNHLHCIGDRSVSPLHAATGNGHFSTVKQLLLLGADPCQSDSLGSTAIEIARIRETTSDDPGNTDLSDILTLYALLLRAPEENKLDFLRLEAPEFLDDSKRKILFSVLSENDAILVINTLPWLETMVLPKSNVAVDSGILEKRAATLSETMVGQLILKLEDYIASDYDPGFLFFKASRRLNNTVNIQLAEALRQQLMPDGIPDPLLVEAVFSEASMLATRQDIIKKLRIDLDQNYVSRGMNSSKLRSIIDEALSNVNTLPPFLPAL